MTVTAEAARTVADKRKDLERWKQKVGKPQHIQDMLDVLAGFPDEMVLLEAHQAITWEVLTPVEREAVRWQRRSDLALGGFWTAMYEALNVADEDNLRHLAQAYPVHVEAIRRWRSEAEFATRLRGMPFAFSL